MKPVCFPLGLFMTMGPGVVKQELVPDRNYPQNDVKKRWGGSPKICFKLSPVFVLKVRYRFSNVTSLSISTFLPFPSPFNFPLYFITEVPYVINKYLGMFGIFFSPFALRYVPCCYFLISTLIDNLLL